MKWLSDLIGGSAGEIIKSVGEVADKFITTDEDRLLWKTKESEMLLKFKQLEYEVEETLLKDKQSARSMYEKDSSLQKVFALIFLLGYITITGCIIWCIFSSSVPADLSNFQAGLIGSVFTAMSTKVNTVVDFLFGGSSSKDESEGRMIKALTRDK